MRTFVVGLVCIVCLAGCEREKRDLRLDPPEAAALDAIALMPNGISGAPPDVEVAMNKPYETNAYQLSQGKRLYEWFNCTGCHANGGAAQARRSWTAGGVMDPTSCRSSPRFATDARAACRPFATR